jgi:ABC-type nitrate/sulfonate/bicarbonate transport system substrate-binding protein
MVRTKFADERAKEHSALIAAISAAASWCDEASNRAALAEMLSGRTCLNLPTKLIAPSLTGRFDCGVGRVENIADFHVFHKGAAGQPLPARATALQEELVDVGLIPREMAKPGLLRRLFRADLYKEAVGSRSAGA